MSGTNNFVVFDAEKINMADDETYQTSKQYLQGVGIGVAPSNVHNKLYYQATMMAAAIGDMVAAQGHNANDNDKSALTEALNNAIKTLTANAKTAAKLATARKINDVEFDGSKDIAITTINNKKIITSTDIDDLTSAITTPGNLGDNAIKDYIDAGDFLNLSPKVGFFNEKQIPIFATYNMSFSPVDFSPGHVITDVLGLEVEYFMASDGVAPIKLYKCDRLSDSSNFSYHNDPIMTPLCIDSNYINQCIGLGNEYIVVYIVGMNKWILYKTKGSSDPSTWTDYVDITTIIGTTSISVEYISDYDTIAIYRVSDFTYSVSLYKGSDLSLINTTTIVNMRDLFNIDNAPSDTPIISISTRRKHGIVYNPDTEQLIIISTCIIWRKSSFNVCEFIYCADISKTFFQNGVGTITSSMTDKVYDCYNGSSVFRGWFDLGYTLTYDAYEQCIRVGSKYETQPGDTTIRISSSIRATDFSWKDDNQQNLHSLVLPDANPWAKIIYRPVYIVEGQLYFTATSTKYGTNVICAQIESSLGTNSTIQIKPGKWWLSAKEESDTYAIDVSNITSVYDGTTTSYYHVKGPGSIIRKVTTSDFIDTNGVSQKGKRSSVDIGIIMPNLPDGISYAGQCGYDHIHQKAHFVVIDTVSTDLNTQGYAFCITYDFNTNTYTQFRSIPVELTNVCTSAKNSYGRSYATVTSENTNMFIDIDGSVYFAIVYSAKGGIISTPMLKLTSTDFTCAGATVGVYYGESFITYDSTFGYNYSHPTGYTRGILCSSKDITGTGANKTATEFFSGSYYIQYVRLAASTGLVAYIEEVTIFLGGYLSTIEAQEISLYANSDNYIYLVRDRANRTKINIIVRTKPIGVEGENGFNRVLAVKATTDSGKVISQTYYDI